jgi:methionyl-tRNA formyltransferase
MVQEDDNKHNLYKWITDSKLDVCFVLGYSKRIQVEVLKKYGTQLFNIHFGSLPNFKGPTPVFWQLKQGNPKLGLSIHRLTEKFDEGTVVWRKEIDNQEFFNYKYVEQVFGNICVEGVFFIIGLRIQKFTIFDLQNQGEIASYQSKPNMEDVLIRWDSMGAKEICNLVKACNPWNKGALTFYKGQEVKIMDARVAGNNDKVTEGHIVEMGNTLKVKCCDGNAVEINMLYFMDSFFPAYCLAALGFEIGHSFEYFSEIKIGSIRQQ